MNFSFRTIAIIFSATIITIVTGISFINTFDLFLKDKEAEALSSLAINAKSAMLNVRQDLLNAEIDDINTIDSINSNTDSIASHSNRFLYLGKFSRLSNTNETLIDNKALSNETISNFFRSDKQSQFFAMGNSIYELKKMITNNDNIVYTFATKVDKYFSGGMIELNDMSNTTDKVSKINQNGFDVLSISIPINEHLKFTMKKDLSFYNEIPQYILITIGRSSVLIFVILMILAVFISNSFSKPILSISSTIRDYTPTKKITFNKKSHVKEIRNIQNSFESLSRKLSGFQSIMFSNIDQGIFLIKDDHTIDEIYSKACLEFFGEDPTNKEFINYIDIGNNLDHNQVQTWLELLFSGNSEIEDISAISPQYVQTSNNPLDQNFKRIEFEFFAIKEENKLKNIVVLAKNRTKFFIDKERLEQLSLKTEIITAYYKNKETYQFFLNDTRLLFQEILSFKETNTHENKSLLEKLHTLKGMLGVFGFKQCQKMIHKIEDLCLNNDPFVSSTIDTLNLFEKDILYLENEMGESVGKNKDALFTKNHLLSISPLIFTNPNKANSELNSIIQGRSFKAFIYSLENSMKKFAETNNKEIFDFEFIGDDFYYPASHNEAVNNLVHIFKNIIEHGIETKDIRLKNNKSACGQITININSIKERTDNGFFQCRISDDGSGFDFDKIKKKLNTEDDLSEVNVLQMLLSKNKIANSNSSIDSGRSIGLTSTYNSILKIGGNMSISTSPLGSTFEIYLPSNT